MIKKEYYTTRKDGVKLFKIYSDEDFKIKQIETKIIYDKVIDIEDAPYTYEETDEKIETLEREDLNGE